MSPPPPPTSTTHAVDNEESSFAAFDEDEFRARWERLWPRYGALWQSILLEQQQQQQQATTTAHPKSLGSCCDCCNGNAHVGSSFLPPELLHGDAEAELAEEPQEVDASSDTGDASSGESTVVNLDHVSFDLGAEEEEDGSAAVSPRSSNSSGASTTVNLDHVSFDDPSDNHHRASSSPTPRGCEEQEDSSSSLRLMDTPAFPAADDDSAFVFAGDDGAHDVNTVTQDEVPMAVYKGASPTRAPPPIQKPPKKQQQVVIEIFSSSSDGENEPGPHKKKKPAPCLSPVFKDFHSRSDHDDDDNSSSNASTSSDKVVWVDGVSFSNEKKKGGAAAPNTDEGFLVDDDEDSSSDGEVGNDHGDDDDSVQDLVKRTKKISIRSSSEENNSSSSSEESEDLSLEVIAVKKPRAPLRSTQPKSSAATAATTKSAFRRQRETMAQELLQQFDRDVFGGRLVEQRDSDGNPKVTLHWSNKLRTTAGMARLKRTMHRPLPGRPSKQQLDEPNFDRTAIVELSTKVLDSRRRLRSTLLHELCHAAAWIIDATVKPPHGACFKKWAGVAMRAVPDVQVTTTHNYAIDFKYTWKCTTASCPAVFRRHSRSIDVEKQVCGRCKGRLEQVEGRQPGTEKKAPSSYNLFVRAQSKRVRQRLEREQAAAIDDDENNKVSQADVLKECARLWRTQKSTK